MFILTDLTSLSAGKKAYLLCLLAVGLLVVLMLGETPIGIATTLTGVMCVVLAAERKLSNFVWAFINAVLYGYISYTQKFYGDMALNWGGYIPFQLVGYYMWRTQITDGVASTRTLGRTGVVWCLGGWLAATFGLAEVLRYVGGHAPLIDASNVALSLVATWLLANRYADQWAYWIAVNISGVWLWFQASGDNSGAGLVMWVLFLINSLYGYWQWTSHSK